MPPGDLDRAVRQGGRLRRRRRAALGGAAGATVLAGVVALALLVGGAGDGQRVLDPAGLGPFDTSGGLRGYADPGGDLHLGGRTFEGMGQQLGDLDTGASGTEHGTALRPAPRRGTDGRPPAAHERGPPRRRARADTRRHRGAHPHQGTRRAPRRARAAPARRTPRPGPRPPAGDGAGCSCAAPTVRRSGTPPTTGARPRPGRRRARGVRHGRPPRTEAPGCPQRRAPRHPRRHVRGRAGARARRGAVRRSAPGGPSRAPRRRPEIDSDGSGRGHDTALPALRRRRLRPGHRALRGGRRAAHEQR